MAKPSFENGSRRLRGKLGATFQPSRVTLRKKSLSIVAYNDCGSDFSTSHGKSRLVCRTKKWATVSPASSTVRVLVNLGGQSISDQQTIEGLHQPRPKSPARPAEPVTAAPDINHNSGWGGLGLQGNRSSGNLTRATSDGSGLFIEEDDPSTRQDAGEETIMTVKKTGPTPLREDEPSSNEPEYIKTSSMARFYYRKNPSFGTVADLASTARTTSDPALGADSADATSRPAEGMRSKSYGTLDTPTSGL